MVATASFIWSNTVVSSADMPTSVAPLSLMASTQACGSTSTPRSTTRMPLELSTVPAMFLPNSWMSFLTVPSTMVPTAFSAAAASASCSGSLARLKIFLRRR